MHSMILVSMKMTSQQKLGEIKLVPYNKPLPRCGCTKEQPQTIYTFAPVFCVKKSQP